MSSRIRLFIENFFVYGLINALNRVIPILLLPVVTRLLTDTADYGRFDMFNTLVSFGSALAGLGVYDAMFREFFEKDSLEYKQTVTSNAFYIVLCSSFLVAGILILFRESFALAFLGSRAYTSIIVFAGIGIIINTVRGIIAAPTRMQNKRRIYIYSGVLHSLLYYVLAIVLILRGHTYLSLIASNLFSGFLLLLFFYILSYNYFSLKLSDKKVRTELYKIGIPLMPTYIIYWVFHSIDKIMITHMIGLDAVGIYSVGSRIASISNFIYAAFAGGWQYFAFSTMYEDDQVQFNSKIFEVLGVVSILALLFASFFDNILFSVIFTGDYTQGVIVFPYLFISPLFLMLFQIAGNQFLVIKKSYVITVGLMIGASLNIVLNYFLIKPYGIKGCALATMLGYLISLVIMMFSTRRYDLMIYRWKYFVSLAITMIFIVTRFYASLPLSHGAALLGIGMILLIYRKEIVAGLRYFKQKIG